MRSCFVGDRISCLEGINPKQCVLHPTAFVMRFQTMAFSNQILCSYLLTCCEVDLYSTINPTYRSIYKILIGACPQATLDQYSHQMPHSISQIINPSLALQKFYSYSYLACTLQQLSTHIHISFTRSRMRSQLCTSNNQRHFKKSQKPSLQGLIANKGCNGVQKDHSTGMNDPDKNQWNIFLWLRSDTFDDNRQLLHTPCQKTQNVKCGTESSPLMSHHQPFVIVRKVTHKKALKHVCS